MGEQRKNRTMASSTETLPNSTKTTARIGKPSRVFQDAAGRVVDSVSHDSASHSTSDLQLRERIAMARPSSETKPSRVEYLLGKGTSRLLNARVNRNEIHLIVNGPAMLYGSGRLLTSLDMADGATFDAWTRLAAALTCTSYCGRNGTTVIPIE